MGLFTSNQPTPEIPPAQTWFDTLELSFADVSCNIEYTLRGQPTPKTDGIDTDAFLRAAKSAMTLFDILGVKAFGIVKTNMKGNIEKIENRSTASAETGKTLQDMVQTEMIVQKHEATQELVWLCRGLKFFAEAFQTDNATKGQDPRPKMETCFSQAYSASLSKHHGAVASWGVNQCWGFIPAREKLYESLRGKGATEDQLTRDKQRWFEGLQKRIGIIEALVDFQLKDFEWLKNAKEKLQVS